MSWTFVALQTAPAGETYENDFLTLAGSLAALSSHPACADIRKVARAHGMAENPVMAFEDFPERGFGGLVHMPAEEVPRAALMGELEFLTASGLDIPPLLEAARRRFMEDGHRTLLGGWDGYIRGVMRFRPAPPAGNP